MPTWANSIRLTLMIADVRRFLGSGSFEPFIVVTSSGSRYRIPSADHATINPQGSRVVVWFDDESGVIISGLHIAAVEKEAPQKAKAA